MYTHACKIYVCQKILIIVRRHSFYEETPEKKEKEAEKEKEKETEKEKEKEKKTLTYSL